jgi:beta-lactam-binding protein with PASTA domain
MKTCPSCGKENADSRDFCQCGEYLRWEATRHVEAVKPPATEAPRSRPPSPPSDPARTLAPAAAVVVSAAPPSGAAVLLLRLPDDESASGEPVSVSVKPGERTTVLGLIRNESGIVDNYDIGVRGIPDGWWTVTPPTAYLVPFGTTGNYEQEVQVHLHPPRSPEAHAKSWAIEVVARSRAHDVEVATAPATVTIEAYRDVGAKLAPDRASGRLKARFVLTVRNRANAAADVALRTEDGDGECQFRFAQPAVTIEPGQGIEAPFTAFPPRQIWLGRPRDRPIVVTATGAGAEQPDVELRGMYRQRPWLPWWLAVVAPIAAAVVALLILLAPKQTSVPNLKRARTVFEAQKLADKAGVKLSPQINLVPSPSAPAGSIVDQSPQAGNRVKRGTLVSIQVARGSGTVKVPAVVGLNPVTADQTLRAAGLQLGTVAPQPPRPDGMIASQIPAAQASVASGTPVQVFLKPVASAKGKVAAGAGAGTLGAATAGGGGRRATPPGGGKGVVVPSVSGDVNTAAQRLSQLGLVPTSTRRIASDPAGTLIGTEPAAGASVPVGSNVRLLVSAGFPELAYDDRAGVHLIDAASGRTIAAAPSSSLPQQEATWSPGGRGVVYSQGGQLVLWDPSRRGGQPSPLTAPNSEEHDPAFAPKPGSNVLAFIDESGGAGRLCLAAVGPNQLNPDCTSHPGFTLTHQISWSPDGTTILVPGVKNGSGGRAFGLIEFTSNEPFTTNARAWGQGRLVTDTSVVGHGILAGAFSPDGKQLALVSNIGTDGFYLFLAPRGDYRLAPPAKATASPACQVGWRPDGQQLVLMQADLLCKQTTGAILTIDPKQLNVEHRVATQAADPAWQPLLGNG